MVFVNRVLCIVVCWLVCNGFSVFCFVVCCMLFVVRWVLCVVCFVLLVVRNVLCVVVSG